MRAAERRKEKPGNRAKPGWARPRGGSMADDLREDPRTVPAALDRLVRQSPDHDALITDDRSFTAAGLRDEVYRAAAALIALGVQPRERVAIWSPNTWHWVVACLAIHHVGAAMVPLN